MMSENLTEILVSDFVDGLAFTSDLVANILKLSPTLRYSQQVVTNMVAQGVNLALDHQKGPNHLIGTNHISTSL